jgi:hypothetical protein
MSSAQLAPASSAELVWQEDKKHRGWTVHLHIGEEVIKYSHPDSVHDAPDAELIALAVEDARQDSYALNPDSVKITR